jgi:hypothetical protein
VDQQESKINAPPASRDNGLNGCGIGDVGQDDKRPVMFI